MTEQFSELASAQRKKKRKTLGSPLKEKNDLGGTALSWQREGAKNTADELDALAADKAKDVIERNFIRKKIFLCLSLQGKQLEK